MATASDRAKVEEQLKNAPDLDGADSDKSAETVAGKDLDQKQVKLVAGVRNRHYLRAAHKKALINQGDDSKRQLKLVAGVGFEPTTFSL